MDKSIEVRKFVIGFIEEAWYGVVQGPLGLPLLSLSFLFHGSEIHKQKTNHFSVNNSVAFNIHNLVPKYFHPPQKETLSPFPAPLALGSQSDPAKIKADLGPPGCQTFPGPLSHLAQNPCSSPCFPSWRPL